MESDFDPTGFDGVWRMYLPDSKVRDPETGEWVPEVIRDQVSETRHEGDVMHFRCRIEHAEDLVLYLGYTCRYGADEWVPYTVLHIEGDPNHESLKPNNFRKVHARVGEPIAFLKQVYVDPRTKVRITRHPDGDAQYVLTSRLSEDRQRNVATVQAVEGGAAIEKHAIRDTGPEPEWPVAIGSSWGVGSSL
jgi:hypothetical protein